MLRMAARCGYANLRSFNVLEQLNSHLLKHKYSHLMLYFRSSWNPQCEVADHHINTLAGEHRFLEVIKVDTDLSPKIAKHYSVRTEPEFVFCLYGDEVIRQIGPNLSGLQEKLNKMVKLGSEMDTEFVKHSQRWVPYGTKFEKYYIETLQPLYDRNVSDL